ncbi:hypothetical protein ACERK3_10245 [Phycisphaerales bacterium AB-hyl4]|uniref:PilZ domain-containing protein n=1 Tax=Natronomicrosphaera hydrolytica TaxID=3242702 RepID=A0ABV4U7F4_9BACT
MPGSGPLNLLEELKRLETLRSPKSDGQRRHQRFLLRTDAELHPMSPQQLDRTPLDIKLRDISRCGMGFISQTPLPQGSTWRACFMQRGHVVGQQGLLVRHCRNVGDGLYLIGGQFCIDTGLLVTLGVEPNRVYEGDAHYGDEDDAFIPPGDVD